MIEQINDILYEHYYCEDLDCEICQKLPPKGNSDLSTLTLNVETKITESVLIVDDDYNIRMAFREILYREGYVVYCADTGKKALECIKSYHPNVAILDIKMPDTNGIEILKQIRKENKNLPIIISTAYRGFKQDPEIALGDISSFMVKPIGLSELSQKVKEALEERR